MNNSSSDRENMVAALLAAGASTRFGSDKLLHRIDGVTILTRAANALKASGIQRLVAILRPDADAHAALLRAAGFQIIENPDADLGMSASLACAARFASALRAKTLLISLADMPFVTVDHYRALAERILSNGDDIAFSVAAEVRTPPAIFSERLFESLMTFSGDHGARDMLRAAPARGGVVGASAMLADIDNLSDCARSAPV